jgi:hypothetical protein
MQRSAMQRFFVHNLTARSIDGEVVGYRALALARGAPNGYNTEP